MFKRRACHKILQGGAARFSYATACDERKFLPFCSFPLGFFLKLVEIYCVPVSIRVKVYSSLCRTFN